MYLYIIYFIPLTAHDLLPGRPPQRTMTGLIRPDVRQRLMKRSHTLAYIYILTTRLYIYIYIYDFVTIPEPYYDDSIYVAVR